MLIELEPTFRTALREGVNLFLGAGFSLLAQDSRGVNLPTGAQLKTELLELFDLQELETLLLPQIATILEATKRSQFYSYLKSRFSVTSFDDRYRSLEYIRIRNIFTTNIDDLIYKIYLHSKNHYINDRSLRGALFRDRTAIDLITLHGSIVHEGEHLEFSTTELASSFSGDPDKWYFLTGQLQSWPTLFWGYSLEDAGTLQALHPSSSHGRSQAPKWIVLRDPSDASKTYFKSLGFNIIESDTEAMLTYIGALEIATEATRPLLRSTADLFPTEAIPAVGSVPVRPIVEFYSGLPPTWHDIFSDSIHKTEHFSRIVDAINSGVNTVVVGIPASGKSTLMMQVAAAISYHGHKLVLGSMTPEKAHYIANRLEGEPALIFIDDSSTDMEALNVIARAPNVRIVAFDRDYSFEGASHLINKKMYSILDVTELTEIDVQSIYNRVPLVVRRPHFRAPIVEQGVAPSVFEVISENSVGQTLANRFGRVLSDLYRTDFILHDVLIMVCYVHSCGVPVSYDTISAFLRDDVNDYDETIKLLEKLGAIMAEYIGSLADEDQDYYTPRSTIVTNAILNRIDAESLQRVMRRFFERVSPVRICRFDVFRKKAYDAGIVKRAFPKWREGLKFYEELFERFESPYTLQQGALYLSHLKQYREAFVLIDKALLLTNSRVWSIRNSHAIILFKANKDKTSDMEIVFRTLKKSMDILAECYRYDRRKAYHALSFADQSLQFSDRFPGPDSAEYLRTAQRWLLDEAKRSPWNRKVKQLLPLIQRKLSSSDKEPR